MTLSTMPTQQLVMERVRGVSPSHLIVGVAAAEHLMFLMSLQSALTVPFGQHQPRGGTLSEPHAYCMLMLPQPAMVCCLVKFASSLSMASGVTDPGSSPSVMPPHCPPPALQKELGTSFRT